MDKNQMPPLHMDVPPMSPAPSPLARVQRVLEENVACNHNGMEPCDLCDAIRDIERAEAHSEAVAALVEAAALKRNAIMRDGQHKGFKGDWIAVPAGDFNALRESLSRLAALEDGA